jgi:hypothetical protein
MSPPLHEGPLCATRSIAMNPGGASLQPEQVWTRTRRRIASDGGLRGHLDTLAPALIGDKTRSMVEVLRLSTRALTSASGGGRPWPCMEERSTGRSGISCLEQIRPEPSHTTLSSSLPLRRQDRQTVKMLKDSRCQVTSLQEPRSAPWRRRPTIS